MIARVLAQEYVHPDYRTRQAETNQKYRSYVHFIFKIYG